MFSNVHRPTIIETCRVFFSNSLETYLKRKITIHSDLSTLFLYPLPLPQQSFSSLVSVLFVTRQVWGRALMRSANTADNRPPSDRRRLIGCESSPLLD